MISAPVERGDRIRRVQFRPLRWRRRGPHLAGKLGKHSIGLPFRAGPAGAVAWCSCCSPGVARWPIPMATTQRRTASMRRRRSVGDRPAR